MRSFRANRFAVDWSVTAAARFSGPAAGRVTDVGFTGFRFISARNFKLRDILDVEVADHKNLRINTTVRVAWKRTLPNGEFNYGVRFETMPFADLPVWKQALGTILAAQIEEFSAKQKAADQAGNQPSQSPATDRKAA